MTKSNNIQTSNERIRELESKLSDIKFELEESLSLLKDEREKREFYQLIADFTFGWELWLDSSGKIKYCSPSCLDLTGFTANQVITSASLSGMLVHTADREKFDEFISNSLEQSLMNKSLEFRIITRTRQLRWCSMNIRGVYDIQGRYLGIRASVQDITKLKRAMGQIYSLTEGREMENRTRQRLKSELDIKERELVSFLIRLSHKNELIAYIARQLRSIKIGGKINGIEKIEKLLEFIEKTPVGYVDWNMVQIQLEKLNPGFMDRLLMKHPRLTNKEKKLCAYIRLGLTSKEIAGLNNLSAKSVEIARVRLRKKMRLRYETRLAGYIMQI